MLISGQPLSRAFSGICGTVVPSKRRQSQPAPSHPLAHGADGISPGENLQIPQPLEQPVAIALGLSLAAPDIFALALDAGEPVVAPMGEQAGIGHHEGPVRLRLRLDAQAAIGFLVDGLRRQTQIRSRHFPIDRLLAVRRSQKRQNLHRLHPVGKDQAVAGGEGTAPFERDRQIIAIGVQPLGEHGAAEPLMGFRAQTPRGVLQLLEHAGVVAEGALGIRMVVPAVVVRRPVDLEGAGWLQHRPLEHRLPGIQPANLLGRLDRDEAHAQQAARVVGIEIHVRANRRIALDEEVIAAAGADHGVQMGLKSPRLGQHFAHRARRRRRRPTAPDLADGRRSAGRPPPAGGVAGSSLLAR